MSSILPAKRDLHRTPVCVRSPVSSSLDQSVYRLCRMIQAHPEIQNPNNFTLGALERDKLLDITQSMHYAINKNITKTKCRLRAGKVASNPVSLSNITHRWYSRVHPCAPLSFPWQPWGTSARFRVSQTAPLQLPGGAQLWPLTPDLPACPDLGLLVHSGTWSCSWVGHPRPEEWSAPRSPRGCRCRRSQCLHPCPPPDGGCPWCGALLGWRWQPGGA